MMAREIIYSGTVIHNKTDSKPGTNSTTCKWENKTFKFKTNENTDTTHLVMSCIS